ncbi:hypothetical protein ACOME3_008349 [Neoechinorhynchus agilis]
MQQMRNVYLCKCRDIVEEQRNTFSVYDVTSASSFNSLDSWKDEFLAQAAPRSPEEFPFICVGNKIDVNEEERVVTNRKAQQWCSDKDLPYIETSAKSGTAVATAFDCIARKAIERIEKEELTDANFNADYTRPVTLAGSSTVNGRVDISGGNRSGGSMIRSKETCNC